MQVTHDFEFDAAHSAGWNLRVLLLSADASPSLIDRIGAIGAKVDCQAEVYTAMAEIIDDPMGYGLLFIDCDSFADPEAAARAVQTLKAAQVRMPMIMLSKSHQSQIFPQDRDEPVCLRAPLSTLSLRVGLEHALRDRLLWNAA